MTKKSFEDEKTLSYGEKYLVSQCTKEKVKSDKPVVVVNILKKSESNKDIDKYTNAVVMNM